MSSLTQDLIKEILLWLPVKSLVRFQSVSKSWLALIKDPNFIETQLQRSIETLRERILILQFRWHKHYLLNLTKEGRFDKSMEFIQLSSTSQWMWLSDRHCNGLFCKRAYDGGIVIWNPSIRKHKKLPPVKTNAFDSDEKLFSAVIGYDVVNNDYKVVIIVQFEDLDAQAHVFIYSLKENSWRRVEDKWPFDDFVVGFGNFSLGFGTYLNGNLNWLVQTQIGAPDNQTFLVTFDLTNEKFQVHPIPVKLLCEDSLEVLEGKLCACTNYLASIMEESGVVANSCWMLEEYGVASSWSLLYTQPSYGHNPLVISEDGQEILIQNNKEFYWYDRKKKTQTNVKILDTPEDFWVASSQGSLLLIDGENDDYHSTTVFLNSEV